jgi:hypothetical protein
MMERLHEPFSWGVNDCCLFAADAVVAVMGVDLAGDLRGTYSDASSALHVLRDESVEQIIGDRLEAIGAEDAPVAYGRMGDIGIIAIDGRLTAAVCSGGHWYAPAKDGLAHVSLLSAARRWRVG